MRTTNTTGRSTDRELPATGRGGRGFGAWKKAAQQSGGSQEYNDFEVKEGKKYVVAFPEDGPLEVVWVHWVPTADDKGRSYDTPRNCPKTRDEDADCPLCAVARYDKRLEAKPTAYFNVIDLDEPAKVFLWRAGKDATNQLDKLFDELQAIPAERGGPLELNSPGVYAVVSKARKGGKSGGPFVYSVQRVKERDLDEDYDLEPLDPAEIEAVLGDLYDSSVIRYSSAEDLKELADAVEN
jgi:hypothetical protein